MLTSLQYMDNPLTS